jgi:flavin-dependent dehydrogenase
MLLVDLALEEGASLQEGARVVSIDNGPDNHAEVHLEGGDVIKARAVVGADGPYSVVARSTGLSRPLHERRGNFAIYVEEEMARSEVDAILGPPEDCRRHSYFFVDLTGMGWAFRKDDGLNVGIGVACMGRSDVGERVRRFLDDLGLGHLKGDLHGHHIPGDFLPRTTTARVLLVGDAAGAGNPTTGCGIEDAMKTGILASRVLSDLQSRGLEPTATRLHAYESSLNTMRRLQRVKIGALGLVNRLQERGLASEHWITLSLRTLVRFDLERFIWSDATRF